MNELLPAPVQTVFRLLQSLPIPDHIKEGRRIIEAGALPCAYCQRVVEISEFPLYNSGVVSTVLMPLCSACRPTFKSCARIVCCTCKRVIGWVDPHMDTDKFIFGRAESYHIQSCPSCVSGLLKSDIIEKVIYLREQYKNYK